MLQGTMAIKGTDVEGLVQEEVAALEPDMDGLA